MKIAFVSYEYPPETAAGGIGTYTYQVSRLLITHNIKVHIFAGSADISSVANEDGVIVHRIKCSGPHNFRLLVLESFSKEHKIKSFDLIESPEIHSNALEIKKQFTSIPLIVRLHAPDYLVESLKKKYLPLKNKLRFFLGAIKRGKWDIGFWRRYNYKTDSDFFFTSIADHISAPSVQMKNWAVKNWHIHPETITVLENPFYETSHFKDAAANNSEKKILFYGRLSILKGLHTATLAMKKILKRNRDWSWIIVGQDGFASDGKSSMRNWMKLQLKNVSKQIFFHDTVPHDQIPFFLRQVSIVLIPSLFESYSYVTIESMSAGKAIVGTSNTGIASLIENKITGFLADAYKVNEWESYIQQLIDDADLRMRIGKAAYHFAESKISINKKIINYYINLFKQHSTQN